MSKGALKELIRAGIARFKVLIKDVPQSERRSITSILIERVKILRDIQ